MGMNTLSVTLPVVEKGKRRKEFVKHWRSHLLLDWDKRVLDTVKGGR